MFACVSASGTPHLTSGFLRIGAGESGKSTVLKQMKLIYAQGFSKTEKLEWKPVVFNNVIQSMRVIFDAMSDYSIEFENKDNEVCNQSKLHVPTFECAMRVSFRQPSERQHRHEICHPRNQC